MEGDELKAELSHLPLDELVQPGNADLDYVIEFYGCEELLPLAYRIIWLSGLKEIFGVIPNDIPIDYEEMLLLSVLHDERNKKMAYENWKMQQESKQAQSGSGNNSVSLDQAIKTTTV
jgi:hypothetical protein